MSYKLLQSKSVFWGANQLKMSFVVGNAFKTPELFELNHIIKSHLYICTDVVPDRYLDVLLAEVGIIWINKCANKLHTDCVQNSVLTEVSSKVLFDFDGRWIRPCFSFPL